MFHKESGPVPETYQRLRAALQNEGIEFVVIGAMALPAYNFRRATEDVDLCVREAGLAKFRSRLLGSEYQNVEGRSRRFFDPKTQVTFDLLVAGTLAGNRKKNQVVSFPDPSEADEVDGIPVVPLARFIELKLVTWRLKDMADVIELIRRNKLSPEFAERLDPLVRTAFLECYDHMIEEDRQEREYGEH